MENASKALLLAAGMLIGILILSLAIYLYVNFYTTSTEVKEQIEANQLQQFNAQFTSHDGREDLTIYDIKSLTNLAIQNNINYELNRANAGNSTSMYVRVYLNGTQIDYGYKDTNANINNSNNLIANETEYGFNNLSASGKIQKYKCSTKLDETTGRVYEIKFERQTDSSKW